MGHRMKTTVDVTPDLLDAARAEARRRGTTLRSIVEEGLQRVLDTRSPAWQLPDASVPGNGLRSELQGRPFADLRDRIYDGRGG